MINTLAHKIFVLISDYFLKIKFWNHTVWTLLNVQFQQRILFHIFFLDSDVLEDRSSTSSINFLCSRTTSRCTSKLIFKELDLCCLFQNFSHKLIVIFCPYVQDSTEKCNMKKTWPNKRGIKFFNFLMDSN